MSIRRFKFVEPVGVSGFRYLATGVEIGDNSRSIRLGYFPDFLHWARWYVNSYGYIWLLKTIISSRVEPGYIRIRLFCFGVGMRWKYGE